MNRAMARLGLVLSISLLVQGGFAQTLKPDIAASKEGDAPVATSSGGLDNDAPSLKDDAAEEVEKRPADDGYCKPPVDDPPDDGGDDGLLVDSPSDFEAAPD